MTYKAFSIPGVATSGYRPATGLPAGAACAFSPASVAVDGGTATSTLTISTTAAGAVAALLREDGGSWPAGAALAGLAAFALRRRGPGALRRRAGIAALVAAFIAMLSACSGSSSTAGGTPPPAISTPAGSYTIVVTATSGSLARSVNYTLVVN